MKELQIEGLVGPTHNYAGLAPGNVASANNAQSTSHPQKAALQSLEKMRFVHELGLPVAVMPPHPRPLISLLDRLHYKGSMSEQLTKAYAEAPELIANAYSASNMWVANAATVTPSCDAEDGMTHFTPANLISSLHRSIETRVTTDYLRQIFADDTYFIVHDALPVTTRLADEGAANHMRLHGSSQGDLLHFFIYGADPDSAHHPARFPARQQLLASSTIARMHQLPASSSVYLQQHPDAIDAGVFHNDVIAMSHQNLLIYHEMAFIEAEETLQQLQIQHPWLTLREVSEKELPLADAVSSYFFNAQLITLKSGKIGIIFPQECQENAHIDALCQSLVKENIGVEAVYYLNLRESMKNGGGPACLRLRVPLRDVELAAMHQGVLYSPALHQTLENIITNHYRESLHPSELSDVAFAEAALHTQQMILSALSLS